jgi:hypothetical protein
MRPIGCRCTRRQSSDRYGAAPNLKVDSQYRLSTLPVHARFNDRGPSARNEDRTVSSQVHNAVEELLARTGVGQQIADELAAQRVAKVTAARKAKGAAIARFVAERARLQPLLATAEKEQALAVQAAEAAIHKQIKVREQFTTVHDELTSVQVGFDAELRTNAHPQIDTTIEELKQLRAAAPSLIRRTFHKDGKYSEHGTRFDVNDVAVNKRMKRLADAIEECERMKIDPAVVDEPAELGKILASIPEA